VSILVAGIGNIFLGDDGFGVEVVRRLANRPLPPDVEVVDFGIRGFDLAHALMGATCPVVLVDATPRGGAPGTLYLIEADATGGEHEPASIETHAMDPATVLRLVHALGGTPPRVLVVGCEPASVDLDEGGWMGLSAPVESAVEHAVGMVESLVHSLLQEGARTPQETPERMGTR
jgi:hydrogenase maturation protease